MAREWPDFLLIGAPKCGTTWLSRRLAAHPSIWLPRDELHFFSRHHGRGRQWYAAQFGGATPGQLLGENSNSYLTEGAAFRIAAEVPQAKLICLLRDPVERAYSSYGMQIDRGRATRDVALYLDPKRSPLPHILTNGLYGRLLEPFFRAFEREQIMVALFDEVRTDPGELYRRVLAFLGAPIDFVPPDLATSENVRKLSGLPGGVKRSLWWLRPYLERRPLRTIRDSALGLHVQTAVSRPKTYPPLTPALSSRLSDYYAPDIALLESLLARPLTQWSRAQI